MPADLTDGRGLPAAVLVVTFYGENSIWNTEAGRHLLSVLIRVNLWFLSSPFVSIRVHSWFLLLFRLSALRPCGGARGGDRA